MKATYIYAGAGSGKTYRLTHDLADMLTRKEDPVDISRIILTTFTKAAAADFVRKAREVLINEKKTPAKAAELDSALIGTVDSVCEQFVKKYWYRLGLTLPLNIISDEDKKLYVSRTTEGVADEKDVRFFYEFAREFKMNEDFWKDTLTAIIEKKYCFGIDSLKRSCDVSCEDIDRIFGHTKVSVSSLFNVFLTSLLSLVEADKPGKTRQDRIKELKNTLSQPEFRQAEFIFSIINTVGGQIYAAKKYWTKLEENGVDIIATLNAAERYMASGAVGKRMKACIERLISLSGKWENAYLVFKQENRLLDFSDLEQKFLRILTEPEFEDVRKDIADSFDVIMVDEFQDSNPVQIKIFRGLMNLVKEEAVFVGDSKQAIFGFRGTESTLVDDFVLGVKDKKSLRRSFRSRPSLVKAANDVFCKAFEKDQLPVDPDDDHAPYDTVSLADVRPEHEDKMGPSLLHWEAPMESSSTQCTTSDYSSVGRKIREIVTSGSWLVVRGKDKDGNEILEPIHYRDIAVLLRRNTKMGKVAKRFREVGVPVSIQDSEFISWAEVQLLLSLLRYIISSEDDCARADILHLIGGMASEDVIKVSLNNDKEAGKELFERLKEIRERISSMSISEIVDSLTLELNLYGNTEGWGLSETRTRNIDFMTGLARKYEQMCGGMNVAPTLPGFIDYVSNYNPEKDKQPVDKTDTVKVLTYHSAKGLEWPMVILDEMDSLDLSEQELFWKDFSGVCHFRKEGDDQVLLHVFPQILWTKIKDNPFTSHPALPQSIMREVAKTDIFHGIKDRKVLEERRLLYVGFTRARDYLVTLGNKKCAYSWLTECKAGEKPALVDGKVSLWYKHPSVNTDLTAPEIPEEKETTILKAWPVPIKGEAADKYQSPSLLTPKEKPASTNVPIPKLVGISLGEGMVHKIKSDDRDVVGTCVHRIFAAYSPALDRGKMIAMAKEMIEGLELATELPSPESVISSIEQLYVWLQKEYGPGTPLHELPFVWQPKGDKQVYRGDMDLVWELPDKECVLIDFKSFYAEEDFEKAWNKYYGYAPQLMAYKDALEAPSAETGKGYKVRAVLVYYFIQGRVVRFEF